MAKLLRKVFILNKLAVLAMTLLIMLGSVLWYLAGNSLTPYLTQYAADLKSSSPELSVSFGNVETNHQQGQALAEHFSIHVGSHQYTPTLQLNNVYFSYDPKSFKKEVVQIKGIVIDEVTLSLERSNPMQSASKLTSVFNELIHQHTTSSTSLGLTGSKEAIINVSSVKIKKFHVTLFDDDMPHQEQVFNDVNLSSLPNAQVMSLLFTQLSNTITSQGLTLFSNGKL